MKLATIAAAALPDTPEHRRFKTLTRKIDAARERLAAWQQALPQFAAAHAELVQPELKTLAVELNDWAFELEALLQQRRWTKAETQTLKAMLVDLCEELMDDADAPDPELEALHDRHAKIDRESADREQVQAMKAMFEEVGGLDLGDEPIDSMDDLMQRAQAGMAGRAEAERAAELAAEDRRAQRRKARQPTAAQRRAEAEAQATTRTVREVYRKLASALHPDRAGPDLTPQEREERTALMQRVNQAYEGGNLLALLQMQLELEQIDIAQAAGVAAAQVRHFNRVLAEQLREIETEIEERQLSFAASYGLPPDLSLQPQRLGGMLQLLRRDVLADQSALRSQQRVLRGDPAAAKRWLRQRLKERQEDERLDAMFGQMLFGAGGRRGPR